MASTGLKVLLLLTSLIVCNAQEQLIHVKPDSCPQECSCSYQFPDCQTLSEYALNTISDLPSKFMLTPGEYYLDSDFSINGTSTESSGFSLLGAGYENTTIYCRQKATLSFDGLTNLTVQNVAFVSCGEGDLPGISLTNINTVKMMDMSVTNTTSGALYIKDSSNVELTNLAITNNKNSFATIVGIQNSKNITLTDLNIFNNSIGEYDSKCVYSSFPNAEEVVFQIDGGFLTAGSIHAIDNVGPFGVLALSNVEAVVNGNWSFKRNLVCLGGSLFLSEVKIEFSGTLSSSENKEISEKYKTTAGVFLSYSQVILNGTLESIESEGYITSIQSVGSNISLMEGASLLLMDNHNGFELMLLEKGSKLIILNGTLTVCNNTIRQRLILVDTSQLIVNGHITFINNPMTPLTGYKGTIHLYGQINFQDNSGIMFAVTSDLNVNGNSTFYRNNVYDGFKDGAFTILQNSTLALGGEYLFIENHYDNENGGAIHATFQSIVRFSGNGIFRNNSAKNGGAIYIDQKSRLELDKGTNLLFEYNSAVKGGAIYIETSLDHVQCVKDPNECLFHPINLGNLNASLTFEHNKAYPGGSVIHVNFDIIDNPEITYPALDDLHKTFNVKSGNNSIPTFASDSYWFCFCENDSRKGCAREDNSINVSASKGKPFSVMVKTLKFYGENMSEPIRRNLQSALKSIDTDHTTTSSLTTDGKLQRASPEECMEVSFTVKSKEDMEVLVLNVGESFLDDVKTLYVNVHFSELCPDGFPSDDNYSCVCDEKIRDYLQSCEITDENFQKRIEYQSYWMAPANQPNYQGAMSWYENCPNRYCITDGNFTFSDDGICVNNRSGVLCGNCKKNTSLMLGGDVCGDCSDNAHLAFLALFAVAGILVVALVFLSQITVTAGTINGLIFYANILNSNQTVFFPKGFFRGYTIFISWLNLNFGIETCFFDGMNQIAYSGLLFVFPVYIWILAGLIVVLCRYSMRLSKFFGNSDPVAVLATIIFLSFNSLTQNIISVFYYSTIKNPDNMRTVVWRYDGNVDFASGHHSTLIIVASVFLLLLLIPYTLVLFSAQVLLKNDFISRMIRRLRLQPFIHSYLVPFKPDHRYWVGLSLLMRAVLLIIFAFGENKLINLLAIITTCIVALTMFKLTGGIYDKSWMDTLEMSFLVNLGVLAAATSYSLNSSINGYREIATYISISIALLTFIGIIVVHVYWRLKKMPMMKKRMEALANNLKVQLPKRQKLIINEPAELEANKFTESVAEMTPVSHVDLREPLLEASYIETRPQLF